MINSISLKNVATYDSTEGVQLNDLKKLNFFFGFNGSGKSTIAKYLYSLSLPQSSESLFNSCSQTGFDQATEQILVFDENFTETNFIKNQNLKSIFSLNETNETIDKKIKEQEFLIKEYTNLIKNHVEKKEYVSSVAETKKKTLIAFCWSQRDQFSSFSKIKLANSGNSTNHLKEIEKRLKKSFNSNFTIEILLADYIKLYEDELSKIEYSINGSLYKQIRIKERELDVLLQDIIVGNEDVDISELINSLSSRSWVETGNEFLKETGEVCPFCQQKTITEDLKKQFNALFDETYKRKIEKLKQLLEQYRESTLSFIDNILKIQNSYNPQNITSNIYINIKDIFDSNISIIQDKIKNPNERKNLISIINLKQDLSDLIQKIQDNNKTFSKLDENRNLLIDNIWNFMASNCRSKIDRYTNKEKQCARINILANRLIESYEKQIFDSQEIIETLRSQTVNTKEAVDNINLLLKNSGFESFEICENDKVNNISQYYLKRPNSSQRKDIFNTLSEGEKSFISFLYFYQLCMGTDNIQNNGSKKKIIVIDDPVSSLDSQTLFIISSLVHRLILRKSDEDKINKKSFKNENIAQIFIFTHNIYFYKEISLERRPMCTDFRHYKVSKHNNKTTIESKDKKVVSDDYSMLWDALKDIKKKSPQDSSYNIVIANTMRRIIDSYVNFINIGNDSWGAVYNLNQDSPEYYLKCAFISEINDQSHKVSVFDPVYVHRLSSDAPKILFDVFKEIFSSIGKEHYERMMEEEIENCN